MKNWQMLSIGAGFVGLLFVGKALADGYLDNRLKDVSLYPAPEDASFLDKIKLISKSPYRRIQV